MIFERKYTTTWHDTNAHRTVSPTRLLVYMQETSNHHMSAAGMSLDVLRDTHSLAFILSKMRLCIYRPLYAFEEISVETWTCPCHGFSIPRCFRIKRGGEIIAEAESTWALVDLESRGLVKGEDCTVFDFEDEAPLSLDIPVRFKVPRDTELCAVAKRRTVWSDLDYNMHMNNTIYADMLCDYIDAEHIDRVRGFLLSYVNESAFGDEMEIQRGFGENTYYFRTVNGQGKICLEAEVILGE